MSEQMYGPRDPGSGIRDPRKLRAMAARQQDGHARAWAALVAFAAVLLSIVLGAMPAWSQTGNASRPLPPGVTMRVEMEPDDPVIGDYLKYKVIIHGNATPTRWDFPEWNQVPGISLMEGPSQGQSFTNVNGRALITQWREFTLEANQSGDVTIPPTIVTINGYDYETEAIQLVIREPAAGAGAMEGILSARSDDPQLNQQLEGNYFATMEFPEEVYVNQAVPFTVYIYRDPGLRQFIAYDVEREAQASDFLFPTPDQREEIRNPNWERANVGGRQFLRTPIRTFYGVPTRAGTLRMTPPAMRIFFQVNNRSSPIDPFFSITQKRTFPVRVPMRPVEVSVKPLPQKPANAQAQIVGNITPKVEVDRRELSRRELLTLKVSFAGEGFLDLLSPPELPNLSRLTLLDQESDASTVFDLDRILSKKDFEYVFQAVQEGKVTIPSLTFAIFNPDTGIQETFSSEPIEVTVNPAEADAMLVGSGREEAGATPENRAEATRVGRDVAYIDTRPLTGAAAVPRNPFYAQPWYWLLQLVPLGIAIGVGAARWRARNAPQETAEARRRKAHRAAHAALRDARQQAGAAARDEFYATLHNGVMAYVGSLLGRDARGLTVDEASEGFARQGVDGETRATFEALMNRFGSIRYSPAPDTPEAREKALREAEQLLVDLDRGRTSAQE